MAFNNPPVDKRESEYNELAFKIARINSLQDRINTLWQGPKQKWFNPMVVNGGFEYGFVIISSCLLQLYKEVKPKCTSDEIKKMDKLRDSIMELTEKEEESIYTKLKEYDGWKYQYNHEKWLIIKKLLNEFEDEVRNLLDTHGYSPDKNAVKGL